MTRRVFILFCVVVLASSSKAWSVDEYRLDDGAGDQNIGITGGSASKASAWLNRFQIEPGKETVTDINVAFGAIPASTMATAYLWGDFNNDGDPSDAFVISSASDFITSPNYLTSTNVFQTFDIPDVSLSVGDFFYVGTIVNDYTGTDMPMRIDNDGTDSIPNYPPNNHSWIAGQTAALSSAVDPNNLTAAQLPLALVSTGIGFDGNWLIRANAVPEPSVFALMIPLALCLGFLRMRIGSRGLR